MTAGVTTTRQTEPARSTEGVVRSWRLRLAQSAERIVRKLAVIPKPFRSVYTVSRLVFQGVAIGLLRPKDLDQFVADGYNRCSDAYDPRRYELPHDKHMLPTLLRLANGRKLLDAFCGQGREAELLATAGFDVTGVDRLSAMIVGARRYAEEHNFEAEFVCDDFATMNEAITYDVVYTSCWMYSTFQGIDARLTFLRKCRQLCRPDGTVVISFDHRVASATVTRIRHSIAKITGLLTAGNRHSEPGDHIASSGLFWHCHTQNTVAHEIGNSGLKIVESLQGTGETPTFLFLSPHTDERTERNSS